MKKLLAGLVLAFFLIAPVVPAHGPPDADLSISRTLQERLLGSWHDGIFTLTFHRHGKVTGLIRSDRYEGTYTLKNGHLYYHMTKISNAGTGIWLCNMDIQTLDDYDLVMTDPGRPSKWHLRRDR